MSVQKVHRILVVDDESDVTELLEYKLEQEGYRVETLNDPLACIAKVREFEPELVLLDIMMPAQRHTVVSHYSRGSCYEGDPNHIFECAR